MGNTLSQWRSAIGSHNNFIKFKESAALLYILDRMQFLLDYYGPMIIPMYLNFPYCYLFLALCIWKVKLLHVEKSKQTTKVKPTQSKISCDSSTSCTFVNISFCLLTILLLLMLCGDVPPNPGPMKFCHLNARSLLAGVDLDLHMDDQYSLLDEIYECLVYINEFDIIAISETWLKDNVRDDALDLAGYQLPICKNRQSRGGVLCSMLGKI